MPVMMVKRDNDWCFLCNNRKEKSTAISYVFGNEHVKNETHFIRICMDCLKRAVNVAEGNKLIANITESKRIKRFNVPSTQQVNKE